MSGEIRDCNGTVVCFGLRRHVVGETAENGFGEQRRPVYGAQGEAKFGGVGHGRYRVILGYDCVMYGVLSLSVDG